MRVITPFDIDDDNMTSSISEPDLNVSEEVWADPTSLVELGTTSGTYYSSVLANGYIYSAGSASDIVKIDPSDNSITTVSQSTGSYFCVVVDEYVYLGIRGYGLSAYKIDTTDDTLTSFIPDSGYRVLLCRRTWIR